MMEELCQGIDYSAQFWPTEDRKRMWNTVLLIYRHDISAVFAMISSI